MTVREIIDEPFRINGRSWPERVIELSGFVGLRPEAALRRPGEFSGG
jgi:ABC-type dipeptide/oligopeptide/nickel transport system ATPase subunit